MSVISERTFYNRRRSCMNNNRPYRPGGGGGGAGNRSVIGGGGNVDRQFACGAGTSEEIPLNAMVMDERWGAAGDENTTVVTNDDNDEYSSQAAWQQQQQQTFSPPPRQSLFRLALRRCSWLCWLCSAFLISFSALVSAPLMVALPHALERVGLLLFPDAQWGTAAEPGACEIDCQGQLLNLSAKTALLFMALYVLFWRRSVADMPRLFLHRTAFAFFVFFMLFAFWLFYIVRILLERNTNQVYIQTFALSLLDILLFIHCIWIFFELRQLRPIYRVQIVRDPDGEWRQHEIGQMSVQEAAVALLRLYRVHFPLYNAQLEQTRRSTTLSRFRSIPPALTGFKLYDIDGRGDGVVLSEMNSRILMQAASQRRMAGHNELFHEECEWERRYRKRKCRLIGCAEEIFAQVQATAAAATMDGAGGGGGGKGGVQNTGQIVESMDSQTAAKAVLSSIAKQLNRFLRFTRQDRFHSHAQTAAHLQRCLAFGFSARAFLQRFFANAIPMEETLTESNWSILCTDCRVSGPLRHGLSFVLRCHDQDGFDRGVQLLCTVSAFPFLNLTEQHWPYKSSSFQLKVLPGNPTGDMGV